jgi:hypothetical protein
MPEPKDLHIDATLSDMSIKYRNEEMIWPQVMPVIKVGLRSNKYMVYTKADSYKLANDMIGPKSLANEIDWGIGTDNYSVKDHALSDWVTQEEIDNSDPPIQPEIDTNLFLNNLLDIAQESRVAAVAFTAATYPAGNKVTLSGTGQWGDAADDPVGNLLTAIETCFLRANTVIMGADTWNIFRKLQEILDAVKGSTRYQASPGGLATIEECRGLFEVENWLVGRGRYISSKEGQTATYARLWGKHCVALHVEKEPSIRSITFGGTFCEQLRMTQTAFDVKRGVKCCQYLKVGWNSDEKVIASDLGYMIENAVP